MPILREDLESGRIDFSEADSGVRLAPTTPGEILREEFMVPLNLSARRLATEIGVPANRVTGVLNGTRAITAETAILLARRFGNSARFWLTLQLDHDLAQAMQRQPPRAA